MMDDVWQITVNRARPWPAIDLGETAHQAEIAPEALGWLPLGEGAYLHTGAPDEEEIVITVTGVPDVGMAGMNVMLLS